MEVHLEILGLIQSSDKKMVNLQVKEDLLEWTVTWPQMSKILPVIKETFTFKRGPQC